MGDLPYTESWRVHLKQICDIEQQGPYCLHLETIFFNEIQLKILFVPIINKINNFEMRRGAPCLLAATMTFAEGSKKFHYNIRRLSNYAAVPFCPWLSLFCPWLSLFYPWLSLFCPWLSLFCPWLQLFCLSLTMVEAGATVQIPGIKGGLLLINMVTMT